MASYGFRMREQNESNLMFEIKRVCDLLFSILPSVKVHRHLIGGKPSSRCQSSLHIFKSYPIVKFSIHLLPI